MCAEEKRPYRIYRAGGRSFPVYLEYDEQMGRSYPAYPDFEEHPEYTGEGRPFATAEQDSCPYAKPNAPEKPPPGDCGGCGWFYREQTPYDPIGICMCAAHRRKSEPNTRKNKSAGQRALCPPTRNSEWFPNKTVLQRYQSVNKAGKAGAYRMERRKEERPAALPDEALSNVAGGGKQFVSSYVTGYALPHTCPRCGYNLWGIGYGAPVSDGSGGESAPMFYECAACRALGEHLQQLGQASAVPPRLSIAVNPGLAQTTRLLKLEF